MAKPGAEQSVQNRWRANQVKVGGVMFAMVDHVEGRPAVALKMSCEQAAQLRSEHKDIVPSPNLNKAHWSTISSTAPSRILCSINWLMALIL